MIHSFHFSPLEHNPQNQKLAWVKNQTQQLVSVPIAAASTWRFLIMAHGIAPSSRTASIGNSLVQDVSIHSWMVWVCHSQGLPYRGLLSVTNPNHNRTPFPTSSLILTPIATEMDLHHGRPSLWRSLSMAGHYLLDTAQAGQKNLVIYICTTETLSK